MQTTVLEQISIYEKEKAVLKARLREVQDQLNELREEGVAAAIDESQVVRVLHGERLTVIAREEEISPVLCRERFHKFLEFRDREAYARGCRFHRYCTGYIHIYRPELKWLREHRVDFGL